MDSQDSASEIIRCPFVVAVGIGGIRCARDFSPMPQGIEARSHACQRRFGWQRQSGGPVPPHPSPLPKGEGASLAALRARGCARYARVGLGLTLSATERVLCRSSRELSGGLDLSPRGTKRRPTGAPACSRLSYGVRPEMGPASNRNSQSSSAVQPDAGQAVESRSLASPQGYAAFVEELPGANP